jgi:Periplasmic copper-binding protein (NosD)
MNSIYGIYIHEGASNNQIDSNRIANTSKFAILIQDRGTNNNIFKNNFLLDNQRIEISPSNLGSSHVSLCISNHQDRSLCQ